MTKDIEKLKKMTLFDNWGYAYHNQEKTNGVPIVIFKMQLFIGAPPHTTNAVHLRYNSDGFLLFHEKVANFFFENINI